MHVKYLHRPNNVPICFWHHGKRGIKLYKSLFKNALKSTFLATPKVGIGNQLPSGACRIKSSPVSPLFHPLTSDQSRLRKFLELTKCWLRRWSDTKSFYWVKRNIILSLRCFTEKCHQFFFNLSSPELDLAFWPFLIE